MSVVPNQNQPNNRFEAFLDRAAAQPEFVIRLLIIFSTLVLLVAPVMFALTGLLNNIFDKQLHIPAQNYLFEGLVLQIVFAFAVAIIAVASDKQGDLEYVMVLIATGLVLFGGVMLGNLANKCIPYQQCDDSQFFVCLTLVSFLTMMGYYIPKLSGKAGNFLAIVYLAASFWSSELWLWVSIINTGIEPSWNAYKGLIILIYGMVWILIFARMPSPKTVYRSDNRR